MTEISVDRISRLIEHVYLAGLDRGRWQGFCDTLAGAYPGTGVALLGHDLDGRRDMGVVASGYAPEGLASFLDHYGAINPWSPFIAAAPVGVAIASDAMLSRESLRSTEFYNDWLKPQGDLIAGVGAVAQSDGRRFLMLNFTMSDSVDAQYHAELELLCNLLGSHLKHAVDLARRLSGADFGVLRRQTFELAPSPVYALDAGGTLRFTNSLGETILEAGGLVTGGMGSILGLVDARAQQRFRESFDALQRRDYGAIAAPFPVICTKTQDVYLMTIAPYVPEVDLGDTPFGFIVEDRPVAVVLLTPQPVADTEAQDSVLKARGLTPAERSLARAVQRGLSLQTYADEHRLSIHTVRNQLRAVFAKLDVRRQSELAVLMGRLASTRLL